MLEPYLTRAKQPDARAARALLALLETYSGVATESIQKSKT